MSYFARFGFGAAGSRLATLSNTRSKSFPCSLLAPTSQGKLGETLELLGVGRDNSPGLAGIAQTIGIT